MTVCITAAKAANSGDSSYLYFQVIGNVFFKNAANTYRER